MSLNNRQSLLASTRSFEAPTNPLQPTGSLRYGASATAGRLSAARDAGSAPLQNLRFYGNGPLLVYISGIDGTGSLCFKQIPGLSKHYRVATFRLRDGCSFTYSDLVEDVAEIIRDAGEERAVVAGESFGGTIALNFAIEHPDMVDRLVIINSFSRYRHRARLTLVDGLLSILPRRLTWFLRSFASRLGLAFDAVKHADREEFFNAIRTVNLDSYRRRLALIKQVDLDDRLKEISAPTLFVAAERDIVVPSLDEAMFMSERVPGSTVQVIKGAGHACMLADQVSLAAIIAEWTNPPSIEL
ncbi:MAG TPA: alpha/beta hydrolase [Blastocatellia bacterium]|nr:alpha/beta hydrolase [Blastocatellia bacterium]